MYAALEGSFDISNEWGRDVRPEDADVDADADDADVNVDIDVDGDSAGYKGSGHILLINYG